MTSEKKRPRLSLKRKVFLKLLLMSGGIIAIMWIALTLFFSRIYKNVRLNELSDAENMIVAALGKNELQQVCDEVSEKYDVCVIAQNRAGRVIASSDGLGSCVIHWISVRERWKLYLDAEDAGGSSTGFFKYDKESSSFLKTEDMGGKNEEHIIRTVISDDGKIAVFINSVLYPVSSAVTAIKISLIVISVILIALSAVFGLFISSSVSKPVRELTEEAKKLPSGGFDPSKVKPKSREIAELTKTIGDASEELNKNERLKEELIANVSHDLRTPLTMIAGYAEVMRDVPGEITPDNLNIVVDETKRLSSLVDDMLEISKLRSGNVRVEREEFDLTGDVEKSILHFETMLKNEGYVFSFEKSERISVVSDRKRILEVLYNLLGNAVTHTGSDKKITVKQERTTHDGKQYVRIEVKDTGSGISKEDLPYIWDRYYKVDKFHKRSVEGSGLGLSIVRAVVEANGGKYGVNTNENGSAFYFELPLR